MPQPVIWAPPQKRRLARKISSERRSREDGGVFAQVSSQELAKGPTPDRMAALAGHVIGQGRCFSHPLLINPLLHPLAVPELPTHPSIVPVPYILQVLLSFQMIESLHLNIRQNAWATLPQPLAYCSFPQQPHELHPGLHAI